jgi:hypothetical protein
LEGFILAAQEDDPRRALLNGDIVIRATHASKRVIAEAAIPELVLVRDDDESSQWTLPPEEVTRTGIAAGLPGSAEASAVGVRTGSIGRMTLLAGIGLVALLLTVGFILIAVLSTSIRSKPERG